MSNNLQVSNLQPGKQFPPAGDQSRQSSVLQNLNLYNGQLTSLGVSSVPNLQSSTFPIRHNWFRRVPDFYSEFCFSDLPIINVRNSQLTNINPAEDVNNVSNLNIRASEYVQSLLETIVYAYKFAMVDMLRFGTGVVYVDEAYGISSISPTSWYSLISNDENVGDCIAIVRNGEFKNTDVSDNVINSKLVRDGNPSSPLQKISFLFGSHIEFLILYRNGETSRRKIFEYEGGNLGKILLDEELGGRSVGSVFPIFNGYATSEGGVSMYDDIKESVAEIARRLSGLSNTLQRNQRPHMYGPASSVKQDINGNTQIDTDGMFFPLQEGDSAPGYLTWDSDVEATKTSIRYAEEQILNSTGLSKLLFADTGDDQSVFANTSGETLKRIMLPFYAKLNTFKLELGRSIKDLIVAKSILDADAGRERVSIDRDKIDIDWQFLKVFQDTQAPMRPNEHGGEQNDGNPEDSNV